MRNIQEKSIASITKTRSQKSKNALTKIVHIHFANSLRWDKSVQRKKIMTEKTNGISAAMYMCAALKVENSKTMIKLHIIANQNIMSIFQSLIFKPRQHLAKLHAGSQCQACFNTSFHTSIPIVGSSKIPILLKFPIWFCHCSPPA